ncbi:MAG TPA: flagellar hook-basal body protein [Candidatus Baltobacteraceae bacterium]|jgi:flagellar basal-body rod protein FlgG|nr:flagellar hook-basal body protein [Candidatus Baltobacteraceae bacterium]
MNKAMLVSAAGMAAQQQRLEVVSDDLANADVVGFKNAIASFASIGGDAMLGTTETGVRRVFGQGRLDPGGGPFDVAIEGSGFFTVERDGERAYTRAGAFARGNDGKVGNADGWHLAGVRIPNEAIGMHVTPDGRVSVDLPHGSHRDAGRIRLVDFAAPEGVRSVGSALFAATADSGPARDLSVGGDREPKVRFGMLERSNVNIVEAMMEILSAQRAYEANSKGVQAADEMQRIANNLERS